MFAEAILWKESVERVRDRRLCWAFVEYIGLVLVGLAVTWFYELGESRLVSPISGLKVLRLICACQCGAALLLGPVWVAGDLVREKRDGTYWALFLSRLSMAEIVAGKVLARLVPLLLVLLSGLPVLVLLMDMARPAFLPLLAVFAVVAGALVLGGGAGACFGAMCNGLYASVFLSYCFLALLLGGMYWLSAAPGLACCGSLVPFVAISHSLASTGPAWQLLAACGPSTMFCASAGLAMCAVAAWGLRRYTPEGRVASVGWAALRIDHLFDRLFPTMWRFGLRRPESEKADALAWREASFGSSGVRGAAKITFCLCMVAASVAAALCPGKLQPELALSILAGAMLFLAGHVTLMASLSVSRDLELRTIDILLMLPVEARHIVLSQFRGVLAGMVLPMAFFIAYAAVLACRGVLPAIAVAAVPVVWWMALRSYAASGMAAALSNKTQVRAALAGLGFAFAITVALISFACFMGFLHEDLIRAMVRPSGSGWAWWRALARAMALVSVAAIWCALAELATRGTLRAALSRFERSVYERE